MSSIMSRFCCMSLGTSPLTMRCAKPSAIAVLPTPGSPTKTGLFFERRAKICTSRRTSSSRPTTGSIWLSRASCVKSRANWFNVGVPAWSALFLAALARFLAVAVSTPIFWSSSWRVLAKLSPKFNKIRAAIISSSRKSANNRCAVPILTELACCASTRAISSTCLALGEYGK